VRGGRCSRVSMMKRIFALFAVFVSFAAFAALPALVLVAEAVEFAAGLVIRNAGKEAVLHLGVAANDATWASSVGMSSVTAWLVGIGALVSTGSASYEKYQVAVVEAANPVLPKASLTSSAFVGTLENPLELTESNVHFNVDSFACLVPSAYSTDGANHSIPAGVYNTWGDVVTACAGMQAFVKSPNGPFVYGTAYSVEPVRANDVPIIYVWRGYLCVGGVSSGQVDCPDIFGSHIKPFVVEPKDGVYRVKRSGDGWIADPTDPDWTDAEKQKLSVPGPVQWIGTSPDSKPAAVEVVKTTTDVVIRSRVQKDPNNIQSRQLAISPTTLNPTSAEESVAPGTDVKTSPSSNGDSGTGTGTWPDDYSREGTLQAVKAGTEQLHKDLTDTLPSDDPSPPGDSLFSDAFFNGTFDALKAWSVPGHTSTCPTGSFSWNSVTYTIDSHCQLVADHFNALQAAMTVVWSLLALFVVLRA